MARARLHIICGNCGCNDMFDYEIVPGEAEDGEGVKPFVYLRCRNCSTIHSLDDTVKERQDAPRIGSRP